MENNNNMSLSSSSLKSPYENKSFTSNLSDHDRELFFLVYRFLERSPCSETASLLARELETKGLLPRQYNWQTGDPLPSTSVSVIKQQNRHITADYLLRVMKQAHSAVSTISPPPVQGIDSFLGSGRFSLLRSLQKHVDQPPSESSLLYSLTTSISTLSNHRNHAPIVPSSRFYRDYPSGVVSAMISREMSGPKPIAHLLPTRVFEKYEKYTRILGHLCAVFCVTFDRTGRYIITGADDKLVKIWYAFDGRLLMTLRGHQEEITDITVDYENTLIASGSCDKIIRVWCLRTSAPVITLAGHGATITSLRFCPLMKESDKRYLMSTSNDGCIMFWQYNPLTRAFRDTPIRFTERKKPGAQIVCSSFSSGGAFLAVGSSDAYLRVYHVSGPVGPVKILEIEEHSDHVDSMEFSHHSTRFASGSRDGIARIWYYEKQSWKNIALNMSQKLPGQELPSDDITRKLRVSMLCWTCDDAHVITSVNDNSIKVWTNTGKLTQVMLRHEAEVFVLEPHPIDTRLILSGSHDGACIIWDVVTGNPIKTFYNGIEGQGPCAIYDCKFSPDGMMFVSTDAVGYLSLFGIQPNDSYKKIPEHMFFHTDYRPVIRDANNFVIDEQSQIAPYLMPPPFLVDIDGNPYPPHLQRLVPGRENSSEQQLIPYVAPSFPQEPQPFNLIQPIAQQPQPEDGQPPEQQLPLQNNRQLIDVRIQELQREHRPADVQQQPQQPQPLAPQLNRDNRNANRRNGDVEGVRQISANFQSVGQSNRPVWHTKPIVPAFSQSQLNSLIKRQKDLAEAEEDYYDSERRKKQEKSEIAQIKLVAQQRLLTRRTRRIIQQRRGVRFPRPSELDAIEDPDRVLDDDDEENDQDFNVNISTESSEESDDESDLDGSDFDWGGGGGATRNGERSSGTAVTTNGNVHVDRDRNGRLRRRQPDSSGDDRENRILNRRNSGNTAETYDAHINGPSSSRSSRNRIQNGREERRRQRSLKAIRSAAAARRRQNGYSNESNGSHQTNGRQRTSNNRDSSSQNQEPEPVVPVLEINIPNPDIYRPPEWLTDIKPKRTPYFPQIGDEIVYFRSGHQVYITQVKLKKIYPIASSVKPFSLPDSDCDEIFAKIDDIQWIFPRGKSNGSNNHHQANPTRLANLFMTVMDPAAEEPLTKIHFDIKYHDVENVVDFIILRKFYDQSIAREWKAGDEFRSLIDDQWWFGLINSQRDSDPFTYFQCFEVTWNSGESEFLSPWDLEPIPPEQEDNRTDGQEVTDEDRTALNDNTWLMQTDEDQAERQRLLEGLIKIMQMGPAEDFIVPVDLNQNPMYAMFTPYLMDLSTIKARFENGFYRSMEALIYDVHKIEENAIEYNEPGSSIVKRARYIAELVKRFIRTPEITDPRTLASEVTEFTESTEAPQRSTRAAQRSTTTTTATTTNTNHSSTTDVAPRMERSRRTIRKPRSFYYSDSEDETNSNRPTATRRSQRNTRPPAHLLHDDASRDASDDDDNDEEDEVRLSLRPWKQNCRDLLDFMFELPDSEPFRSPVDPIQYPTYNHVIDTPMDLTTVKEQLLSGIYESPQDFCKDMRLIFQNSKVFNTNRKSRIYSMRIRLNLLFEEKMQRIVSDHKSLSNYILKGKRGMNARLPIGTFFLSRDEVSFADSDQMEMEPASSSERLHHRHHRSSAATSQPSTSASTSFETTGLCSPSPNKSGSSVQSGTGPSTSKRTLFSDEDSRSYGLRKRVRRTKPFSPNNYNDDEQGSDEFNDREEEEEEPEVAVEEDDDETEEANEEEEEDEVDDDATEDADDYEEEEEDIDEEDTRLSNRYHQSNSGRSSARLKALLPPRRFPRRLKN